MTNKCIKGKRLPMMKCQVFRVGFQGRQPCVLDHREGLGKAREKIGAGPWGKEGAAGKGTWHMVDVKKTEALRWAFSERGDPLQCSSPTDGLCGPS